MPRKQKVETKQKQKKIGFHILSAAVVTLVFVGGSVFLLLSPLLVPFLSQAKTSETGAGTPQTDTAKMTVYLVRSTASDKIVLKNASEPTSDESMLPLLQVPENSVILNYLNSEDKNIVVFSISSISNFKFFEDRVVADNFMGLPDQQISNVFAYDKIQNKVTFLFSSNALTSKNRYIYPANIKNNKYISFENRYCNECGVGVREGLVYDLQTKKMKEIGPITELHLLDNGMYEYKEYIPEKCPIEIGECFKDPANLPFIKGELK